MQLKTDIIAITDTRLSKKSQRYFVKNNLDFNIFFSSVHPQPKDINKGIAVLIKRSSDIKVVQQHVSNDGMSILLELIIQDTPILGVFVYGPSDTNLDKQNTEWWKELKAE